LIVRRDDAEPASRMDGRDGDAGRTSCERAGLEGRGARCGSGLGAAAFGTGRAWGGALTALAEAGLACLAGCFGAAFAAARLRGALPRAEGGFLDGLLEELTPELITPIPTCLRKGILYSK
jgi:hypothetical protein